MSLFFKQASKDKVKNEPPSLSSFVSQISKSGDFKQKKTTNQKTNLSFSISFISTLVDNDIIQQSILPYLLQGEFHTLTDIHQLVPIQCVMTSDITEIEDNLLTGSVLIILEDDNDNVALIPARVEIGRSIDQLEIEYSVDGPKAAFVESLDQNLNLVRTRLPIKELVVEEFIIGTLTKTRTSLVYIDGLTNIENVNTMRERIENIDFDQIQSSSYIEELISDNYNSPFPQLMSTENPVEVAASLGEGKVAVLVNGSPFALLGPTNIFSFFSSFEDYANSWYISTFVRLLRIIGIIFSILATPIYVAVLTYHPEIIPKDVMATLISSRENVPFPPILEALFLELAIELLREAGARLPTKVGQTIGIVGGIVLGTAVVEAGLTSNVLLIFVAIGALAAFTTPIYKISNTARIIRFPFLLVAHLWGLLGINLCIYFVLSHLLQLKSLNRPFLEPIYPPRLRDVKDSIIRATFIKQKLRPGYLQTQQPIRFSPKKKKKTKDIDE
ncbi:spore germination protein [Bacillus sp. FSL K6-3431]|uniref:spore germination protein n=1 Tax=Bacillus sp. FSL K6-3431 TaxID=2921500 RepID=UPI0030F8BF28